MPTIETKRLASGSSTPAGVVLTVYTAPAGTHVRVRTIYASTRVAVTDLQFIDASGARLIRAAGAAVGSDRTFDGWLVLAAGDVLYLYASAATAIVDWVISGTVYQNV